MLKHEMGKASQIEKSSEFTLPILGNEPQMENESRGKEGGGGRDTMGDNDTKIGGSNVCI